MKHAPAIAAFGLLALAWTWPLALHLDTHVPGINSAPGDNLAFVWNLWWMRTALHAHANPFFTTYLFQPLGADLTQHTHTALQAAVGATVFAPMSPVAAQNVLLIVSLFLNGLTAYLLAWRLTANRFAALAGGIVFAGAAPVLVRLLGHFNLVSAWVIPLAVLAWLRALERRSLGACVAAGAALAAAAYSDYYYLAYTVLLLAACAAERWFDITIRFPARRPNALSRVLVALLVLDAILLVAIVVSHGFTIRIAGVPVVAQTTYNERAAFWLLLAAWALTRRRVSAAIAVRDGAAIRRDVRALGLASATFVCLALPLMLGAARLFLANDYTAPHYGWRSAPAGVDVVALLLGSPLHPLTGGLTRRAYEALHLDLIEGVGWLGIVAPAMLIALSRRLPALRSTRFWAAVAASFGVWALGTRVDAFGMNTGLMLPATLFRFVPLLSNVRIPGRAMAVVSLALAVLLAEALARAGAGWPGRRRALVLALLLADAAAGPLPLYRTEAPSIYSVLAADPGAGAVLHVPLGLRDGFGVTGWFDERTLYFQTLAGRPMLGGFVARLPQNVKSWYDRAPVVSAVLKLSDPACPAGWTPDAISRQEAYDALERASVGFVVLDRSLASDRLLRYVGQLPVRLVARDGDRELYQLTRPSQ